MEKNAPFSVMNMHSFRWIRLTAFSALAAAAITSCASAATDFNQVGKQMSLLLQNLPQRIQR